MGSSDSISPLSLQKLSDSCRRPKSPSSESSSYQASGITSLALPQRYLVRPLHSTLGITNIRRDRGKVWQGLSGPSLPSGLILLMSVEAPGSLADAGRIGDIPGRFFFFGGTNHFRVPYGRQLRSSLPSDEMSHDLHHDPPSPLLSPPALSLRYFLNIIAP